MNLRTIGLSCLLGLWPASVSWALDCTNTSCAALARVTEASKHYTSGKYAAAIAELKTALYPELPEEHFYLGVSHFGLYGQTRSKALQCQFREDAINHLKQYLALQRDHYATLGDYGPQHHIRYVYVSTRVLDELSKVDGCMEEPMSMRDLRLATQSYTSTLLDRILMQAGTPAPLDDRDPTPQVYQSGMVVWSDIQKVTRSLVSAASESESEISKKYVEADAAKYWLGQIEQGLKKFGDAQIDPATGNVSFKELDSDGILRVEEEVKQSFAAIDGSKIGSKGHKQFFQDALSGLTPEVYDKQRKKVIAAAKDLRQKNLWAEKQIKTVVIDKSDQVQDIQTLAASSAGGAMAQIRSEWLQYGNESSNCGSQVLWYCPQRVHVRR